MCDYLQIHDYNLNEEDLIFEDDQAAAGAEPVVEQLIDEGDMLDDNMINDDARN